ncbi:MAG TPA: hypothetical protein VM369_04920 [Candidatus Binatia bacterium]|nr:hypothetical protein [Candidatus Binatia bacterium]
MIRSFSLLAASLLAACVNLEGRTAAATGCDRAEVTVSDHNRNYGEEAWTATCGGRTYYCQRPERGETRCSEGSRLQ